MVDFRAKTSFDDPLKIPGLGGIENIFALKSTIFELLPFLQFFGSIFELLVLSEFTTEFPLNGHFVMRTNRATHGGMGARIYFLGHTLLLGVAQMVFQN